MNKPKSPCLKCNKRTADCHSDCSVYKFFVAETEIYKEFVSENRNKFANSTKYSNNRLKRMRGER